MATAMLSRGISPRCSPRLDAAVGFASGIPGLASRGRFGRANRWTHVVRARVNTKWRCSTSDARPYAVDLRTLSPKEREALRLRSKAIPLVADHDPLDIVYEDETFLVVSKPGWLKMHPVHRFQGGTLLNRVIGYLGYNPHMCHRLDMHTSGVVMFLKTKTWCTAILEAFQSGAIFKEYLCLVDVANANLEGSFAVSAPIQRHPLVKFEREIGDSREDSKPALTDFHLLGKSSQGIGLLLARPMTGRTHQIRLHAKYNGTPIVGDDVYGRERSCYASVDEIQRCSRDPSLALFMDGNPLRAGLKLHAWRLSFRSPVDGTPMRFTAPPPHGFVSLAHQQGLVLPEDSCEHAAPALSSSLAKKT